MIKESTLWQLREAILPPKAREDIYDFAKFARRQGLAQGECPNVAVGELFYCPRTQEICARIEDTQTGDYASVLVAAPHRDWLINERCVDDERLEALRKLIYA